MRVALGIYAVVYVTAIAVTIVADIRSKDPFWEIASDAVLLPLGLVGIILYGIDVSNPNIKLAWRLLAPLIVVGQVSTNLFGRYRNKERIVTERHAVWFADFFTVMLLLPMFITNLAFAFS